MRSVSMAEMMDLDSDFHVERHAEEAQRSAAMAIRVIEKSLSPQIAEMLARKAATAGAKALEIIERRGSDDVEFFCGIVLPANPPIPPNAKLRLLIDEMCLAPRPKDVQARPLKLDTNRELYV
jgi:hypothetical protein